MVVKLGFMDPGDIYYLGLVDIDRKFKTFGILQEDRRRHMYILGKSGVGKSTLMENMILQDIYAGNGITFLHRFGDYANNKDYIIQSSRENYSRSKTLVEKEIDDYFK